MTASHPASQDLKLCGALQKKQNFDKTNFVFSMLFFQDFWGVDDFEWRRSDVQKNI